MTLLAVLLSVVLIMLPPSVHGETLCKEGILSEHKHQHLIACCGADCGECGEHGCEAGGDPSQCCARQIIHQERLCEGESDTGCAVKLSSSAEDGSVVATKSSTTAYDGDRIFCGSMEFIFSLLQSGKPHEEAGFPGLKPTAHVFWRTYPSVNPWFPEEGHARDECIAQLLRKYPRIHLLDVERAFRNHAKKCAVDHPYRFQLALDSQKESHSAVLNSSKGCDTLHYCLGTVQHTWNLLLARRRFLSFPIFPIDAHSHIDHQVPRKKTLHNDDDDD